MDEEQRAIEPQYSFIDPSGMRVGVQLPNVKLRLYGLSEDQLQALETGGSSVSLGMLGLFGGVAFSALTTIATVELSDRAYMGFLGTCVASTGISFLSTALWWKERTSIRALTARIRQQHGS